LIDLKEARTRREEFFARGVKRFFFSNLNLQEEREEGGRRRRERERKSGGGGGAKGSIAHIHTHTERERENERGDVRLFYDKNFVRLVVSYNCPSSTLVTSQVTISWKNKKRARV